MGRSTMVAHGPYVLACGGGPSLSSSVCNFLLWPKTGHLLWHLQRHTKVYPLGWCVLVDGRWWHSSFSLIFHCSHRDSHWPIQNLKVFCHFIFISVLVFIFYCFFFVGLFFKIDFFFQLYPSTLCLFTIELHSFFSRGVIMAS
jgi:hypothetical protein